MLPTNNGRLNMTIETIHTTCPKCGAKGVRNVYNPLRNFYVDAIRRSFCKGCNFEQTSGITYTPEYQAALLQARKLLA